MKKFLFCLCYFLGIIAYGQEELEFIEIRIKHGYTLYGTNSLKLLREGLIYWQFPFWALDLPEEEQKEQAKFIPSKDLDSNKVAEIQKYVYDRRLYEIKKLNVPEYWVPSSDDRPPVLSFVIGEKLYSMFFYEYPNEDINKLLNLMNELIPMEDRKKFNIYRIPRGGFMFKTKDEKMKFEAEEAEKNKNDKL
jgi:hypothetical protein